MGQLRKQRKTIPITWACPVLPLSNFKLAWVGTNIENCYIQFVTKHCILRIYETTQLIIYNILKEELPLVITEASIDQHSKYHHHYSSDKNKIFGPFCCHRFI